MATNKTVIVNELLAFIQNAVDTMDEISIMQICKSNFKEQEICSGKALLYQSVGKTAQMPSRRRDGGERSVQDIITLLKQTDPDDVPDFVAKELHKLPPVGFDHVDVTRLLKDITFLKSSLADVLAKLEASDKTISGLQAELLLLRSNNSVSRSASDNVNVRRGAQNASLCSFESAQFDAPECPVAVACASNVSSRPAAPAATSSPAKMPTTVTLPPPRPCDYAAATASTPTAAHTKGRKQSSVTQRSTAPVKAPQKEPCDAEGFTLVVKKKKTKPSCKNQCGTASRSIEQRFRAEVPSTMVYVSRVHFSVKVVDVVDYLQKKTGLGLRVEKLDSHRNVSFNSFAVRVPTDRISTFMDPEFWPRGVKYRRFRGRLPTRNPTSRDTSTSLRVN